MLKKFRARRNQQGLSVYSNLSARRRVRRDKASRRRAEYLAKLPKHPIRRFFYRLHPRRVAAFWFSREGAIMALKLAGISALLLFVMVGALFALFRRELDAIRPGEINKRVQTTVTTYYDRNGVLLWEDKGDSTYKLVVKSDEISNYMKQATVAIEDKDFYHHRGISPSGIVRAAINNFTGGSTQGGSTLTQQLVKQVFFADQASQRGLNGIPRKIKEAILAIEVERMYNKDQILTLYLNESPYGGRRNGVESAAQTYFGKPAKDLTLPEAALIASIPQQPTLYNPYNTEGNKALIERQRIVLDKMAEQGYITKQQAEDAKKVPILDSLRPESSAYQNIKAPHFIQMVRQQLIDKLGSTTVGRGGLIVKTTLDWRAQQIVESAVDKLFKTSLPRTAGFDNSAVTVIDVPTGQVLALMGSRDYNYPGYGAYNAAISYLQPGSSIKPFVYANLFKGNYGAGSVLRDEPINQIYGAPLNNFDNKFKGDMTIREALAQSRNIPAVKAMYITGRDSALRTIHDVGDLSYCTDGKDAQVGLAAAIGGCGLKQIEHANSFATLARGGIYKPVSTILEVKNAQGQVLQQWKDEGKRVLDPQIPYILDSILSDDAARAPSFGFGASGLNVPGVKTATKTGTSNLGNRSKDLWMNSYTPRVVTSIWVGNHDSRPMNNALSSIVGPTINNIMGPLHLQIFQKDGSWKPGEWFQQPPGIQRLTVAGRTDLFPSWYNKPQSSGISMAFDTVSKKKATSCTPPRAIKTVTVEKYTDPVTKRDTFIAPDGFDPLADDTLHQCSDLKPFVSDVQIAHGSGDKYTITAAVNQGTNQLQSIEFRVDNQLIATVPAGSSGNYTADYSVSSSGKHTVTITVIDQALYDGSATKDFDFQAAPSTNGGRGGLGPPLP